MRKRKIWKRVAVGFEKKGKVREDHAFVKEKVMEETFFLIGQTMKRKKKSCKGFGQINTITNVSLLSISITMRLSPSPPSFILKACYHAHHEQPAPSNSTTPPATQHSPKSGSVSSHWRPG